MIKSIGVVILLLFLTAALTSFAQNIPGGSKVYSGFLHRVNPKLKNSLWHSLFGGASILPEEILEDQQCSLEFKSTASFLQKSVALIPEKITYSLKFNHQQKDAFKNYVINIYTDDDQEYSIDPHSDASQHGVSNEHTIFDSYLKYVILGTSISHIDIISTAGGNDQEKYVLDKLEIQDTH